MLEVCVDNIRSVQNAFRGGADRIELCSSLAEGGLTPSLGFLKATRSMTSPDFPIFPMIRPRGGNFIYSDTEVEIMKYDIRNLKEGGANGFVFGLLCNDRKVDVANCKILLAEAGSLPVTFHRAFDEAADPEEELDKIIDLGFARLLTSGQAETAEIGRNMISRLVKRSNGKVVIMPGAGICPTNLQVILETTRAIEFHGSAKGPTPDDGYAATVTSENIVKTLKDISKDFIDSC